VAAPDRQVETFEVTWTDPTRPTPPHGGFAGAPDRTLRVRFYLPVGGSPAPLVVFAHGNNSVPEQYELPLQALARRGYAVAAPAYPSTNAEAPGGASPADLANQPADTTFVIDRILAADDGAGRLRDRIDTAHIAVAGHSIGGFTAGEMAFSDTCADDRVDAAIVMAAGFGGCAGSRAPDRAVPLLVIHGDADTTVPYALGRSAFAAANRPKYLLTVIGGSHSGDVRGGAGAGARAVDATVLAFLDATLRAAPAALDALRPIPGVTRWESRP
jgi:dienelactone hydrolase